VISPVFPLRCSIPSRVESSSLWSSSPHLRSVRARPIGSESAGRPFEADPFGPPKLDILSCHRERRHALEKPSAACRPLRRQVTRGLWRSCVDLVPVLWRIVAGSALSPWRGSANNLARGRDPSLRRTWPIPAVRAVAATSRARAFFGPRCAGGSRRHRTMSRRANPDFRRSGVSRGHCGPQLRSCSGKGRANPKNRR
jgi:hypothetical protein